jgi:mRNA interferase RelE/StbE
MFVIEYRRPARKALMRLPKGIAMQFLAAFESLAADPGRRDLDVKPMIGRDGYRLRIGRWRALYRVENDRLVILILHIGSRGDVYK